MKTRRRTWICAALAVGVLATALVVGGPSAARGEVMQPPANAEQTQASPAIVLQPGVKTGPGAKPSGPVASSAGEMNIDIDVVPTAGGGAVDAQPASLSSGK